MSEELEPRESDSRQLRSHHGVGVAALSADLSPVVGKGSSGDFLAAHLQAAVHGDAHRQVR